MADDVKYLLNGQPNTAEQVRSELARVYGDRRAEEILAQLNSGDLDCASTLAGYVTKQ